MRGSFTQAITRTTRYIVLVLFGFTVSMGIAYGVVRYLTIGVTISPVIDVSTVEKAAQLRHVSNNLLQLMGSFLDEVPLDATALKPGARQWIARAFTPRLNDLRDQLEDDTLAVLPPCQELVAASDRAVAMAAHPEDHILRRRAAEAVLKAVRLSEDYILGLHVSESLQEPPQKSSFKL